MKTFHVQLPFQAATDSYPTCRAGKNNTLTILLPFSSLTVCKFKTIRVPLKKESKNKQELYYINDNNALDK